MFKVYTDRARKVMALANQEALRRNHEYLGPEHVLIAFLREGHGVAGQVLDDLGITLAKLREVIDETAPPGPTGPETELMRKLPHQAALATALRLAEPIARKLGHSYVGTEHLLVALLQVPEGAHQDALRRLGVPPDRVTAQIMELFSGPSPEAEQLTPITIFVDPGEATPEEIAELLHEISVLYQMVGGSGVIFAKTEVREGVVA